MKHNPTSILILLISLIAFIVLYSFSSYFFVNANQTGILDIGLNEFATRLQVLVQQIDDESFLRENAYDSFATVLINDQQLRQALGQILLGYIALAVIVYILFTLYFFVSYNQFAHITKNKTYAFKEFVRTTSVWFGLFLLYRLLFLVTSLSLVFSQKNPAWLFNIDMYIIFIFFLFYLTQLKTRKSFVQSLKATFMQRSSLYYLLFIFVAFPLLNWFSMLYTPLLGVVSLPLNGVLSFALYYVTILFTLK